MTILPNGCKCSFLKVSPANWETSKASLKKNWYIYYRCYDPASKAEHPKGKLRIIKGMNDAKTLEERRAITKALMDLEVSHLKIGYNPILEKHFGSFDEELLISRDTPFLQALQNAFTRASFNGRTKEDIKSLLKYVEKAAIAAGMCILPISEIRPSHILLLLEKCGRIKDVWTANTYNVYLKYLSILFGELLQHQAVEFNPVRDIKKKKVVKQLRSILTAEDCARVDQFTKVYDRRLWLFIHIFFHSGSRTTEIMKVQREHVDLVRQKIKYLVLKGRSYEWVERTIKDIALPFWREAVAGCGPKDYVFSKGLKPGANPIRVEQVGRRWRRQIKEKLGISCDFYSLKHLNTDQTAAMLDLKTASLHNSHKSTNTTKIYAVNEKERAHQKVKEITNHFGIAT